MPASQSLSVAGQPSISLVIPHDSTKRMSNLGLPLSPLPSYSWDVQEDLEDVQRSDESAMSSPPRTPGLLWDEHRSPSNIADTFPKSVFEDWDDPPVSSVVIEEDGAQTLFITPESSFYYPPPTPPTFEFTPFSSGLFLDVDSQPARQDNTDESEPIVDLPLTPVALERPEGVRPKKGQMLFVDTTRFASLNGDSFTLSASLFYSPADEVPLWSPKAFMYGPDVPLDPLDCIYSAGDISPVEHWDEKLWSPTFFRPIRTA